MICNFTNSKATEVAVLVKGLNEETLIALLPYSGRDKEFYDNLPF